MNKKDQSGGDWLSCPRPAQQAVLRLLCFPYAGGGSYLFRTWPNLLSPPIEVCPVQLPGRANRMQEPPFNRLSPLVETAIKGLLPNLSDPFALFGHSMGAAIAFEVAHLLRSQYGREPAHLFVSGHRAPHLPYPGPMTYDLPAAEFIRELYQLNGTPKELLENPEIMELMIPLLRADFELIQTYEYVARPPLNCAITALGGLADRDVNRDHLEAWRHHTTGRFSLRMLQGDHFFLHTAQPLLRVIARELEPLTSGMRK
jgi:medium-chain acyl-[acyl-carrier-protein] hydrolase